MAAQQWQPIKDGDYGFYRDDDTEKGVIVLADMLGMYCLHESITADKSVAVTLPADVRLCRLVDATPAYPEPDWSSAPDGAEWWAVDPFRHEGVAIWYWAEPFVADYNWDTGENFLYDRHVPLPLGCDWRLTLRRRPEVTP